MKLNEHSTATSVYLEQMGNHIEIGEGYTQLRRLLFRELLQLGNSETISEDRLSDSIVTYLTGALNKSVNFHRSQHTFRILQEIIEDLITYADEIMTPAMHNQLFISALVNVASPKIVTFNSKVDNDCRTHALTIFAYWFNRFGREEDSNYQLFIQAYNQLKTMKLVFPTNITLKPDDYFKKQLEKEKKKQPEVDSNASPNTNRVILQDIHDFTGKTEALMKQNIKSVANTQYVRLIKHKSKVLFEFTSKPTDFNEKEKNLVKQLYKRLRVVLKEVEKIKETTLQTKQSSEAQKQYVQAKITPKKSPQTDSPISNKKQVNLLESEPKPVTSGLQKKESNNLLGIQQVVKTPKKAQQVKQVDLLNDDVPAQVPKPNEQQQFVDGILVNDSNNEKKEEAAALFQVFSTPKKQVHEEEGILLAKQSSSKSNKSQDYSPSFQNQKAAKNPYSYIPDNLNLTPTSSVQDDEEKVQEKPGFSLFGLLNFGNKEQTIQKNVYDEENLHYDSPHKKGKKCSEEASVKVEFTPVELPPDVKDIVTLPNYKPVEPVRYQVYAQPVALSPQNQDEESKFELSPKKSSEPQLEEIQMKAQKSGEKIKLSQE